MNPKWIFIMLFTLQLNPLIIHTLLLFQINTGDIDTLKNLGLIVRKPLKLQMFSKVPTQMVGCRYRLQPKYWHTTSWCLGQWGLDTGIKWRAHRHSRASLSGQTTNKEETEIKTLTQKKSRFWGWNSLKIHVIMERSALLLYHGIKFCCYNLYTSLEKFYGLV